MSNSKPLILIGGGGHSSVLVDILRGQGREILAVISPEGIVRQNIFFGIKHFVSDNDVLNFSTNEVCLINCIGPQPRSSVRYDVNKKFIEQGYSFETVVSEKAIVSPSAKLCQGAQVLPGAIIQAGAVIGNHSIVNTGAIVEHDCYIGEYNHIAPGATICGQVVTGSNVYIGAGSKILNNIKISQNAIVGTGAVLTQALGENQICYPSRSEIKLLQIKKDPL